MSKAILAAILSALLATACADVTPTPKTAADLLRAQCALVEEPPARKACQEAVDVAWRYVEATEGAKHGSQEENL